MDGVSDLPVDVIHRILSFIPCTEDAIHTSVLSKTWLRAWSTNPRLNFCHRRFGKKLFGEYYDHEKAVVAEEFIKFVDTTLQRHRKHSPGIIKFDLSVSFDSFDDRKLDSLVDKWLRLVVRKSVREISIYLNSPISTPSVCTLLQSIFDSWSLTSLKVCVSGFGVINFRLEDDVVQNCCSLKKLHLEGFGVKESAIRCLSSAFPLIEDLTLILPDSFWNIEVAKLKKIEISNLPNLKNFSICSDVNPSIKISQPHCLESFTSSCDCYSLFDTQYINIFPCQHLTYLNLSSCNINDMCFHKLISQCPVLEYLILHCCKKLRKVKVSSHSLKNLEIGLAWELQDVEIDAPNLTKLHYDTNVVPSFSSTSHDLEATVSINCWVGVGTSFFIKLKELVTQISLSQISLTLGDCDNISFNIEEVRKVPLLDHKPKLENLKMKIESPLVMCSALLDGLLWSFCLQNLTVSYDEYDPEPTKFLFNELMNLNQSCCSSIDIKCWRHYLKQVEVVCYEESAEVICGQHYLKQQNEVVIYEESDEESDEDEQMISQQLDWKSLVDGSITPKGHLRIHFSFHW